jgi:hypothetical protein
MDLLGMFRVTSLAAARRRDEELRAATQAASSAAAAAVAAGQRAEAAERAVAELTARSPGAVGAGRHDEPLPITRELIAMADRLADITRRGTGPDTEPAAGVLRWVSGRVQALLALCEVAPIEDQGELDFLRHEVVGDRAAPRPELVDHIADTVRPGYQWRTELVRPQQVIAYVPVDTQERNVG